MNDAHSHSEKRQYDFWSRAFIWSAIIIIGYYLLTEHQAHVFAALPWLLILACPLMHLFMGHGGHGAGRDTTQDSQGDDLASPHRHG